MDGFTYENMPGGWSVCDVCGVRVSEELKHQTWHREQNTRYRWVDAPDWAVALLGAVEEYEDTHPRADECLQDALSAVPGEARIFAAGVRKANRGTRD